MQMRRFEESQRVRWAEYLNEFIPRLYPTRALWSSGPESSDYRRSAKVTIPFFNLCIECKSITWFDNTNKGERKAHKTFKQDTQYTYPPHLYFTQTKIYCMIGLCLLWPEMSLVWPEVSLVWPEVSLVWPEIAVSLKSLYIAHAFTLVLIYMALWHS